MLQLHTLGRLELTSANGQEVRGILAQPKRAALLVYLAVAQRRSFHRRDALLARFWQELDQERGRAALRKAAHHFRQTLGDGILERRGDEELRLSESALWCDAVAFEEALEQGDPARAFELYHGPFLEALFLPDAPEFERWLERERAVLHRRAFEAAWGVAVKEEALGNPFGAAHWARRAAELAPADEAAVRKLMTLLDQVGDRAGALEAHRDFSHRLRVELETAPSAETQALAQRIRQAPNALTPVTPTPDAPTPDAPALRRLTPDAPTPSPPRSPWRWIVATAAVIPVVALLGDRSPPREVPPPNLVAVLPFDVRGNPALEYLGEGLVTLLSTGLDGAGTLRTVDPNAILGRFVDQAPGRIDPARGRRLADQLGAGSFVLGDVVASGAELRIRATLYDARGRPRPGGPVGASGPADSLFELADRVTASLISQSQPDSAHAVSKLAALTTHSIPALKAYLDGERDFRKGIFVRALAGFEQAVALDSTFAFGWYRLANAYSWTGSDSSRYAAERAVALADRLPGTERELLDAFLFFNRGQADEAERRYRAILRRRPDELDALFVLGDLLFHYNPGRGRPLNESRKYFQRAMAWNYGDAPLIHLLENLALDRDYAGFDSLVVRVAPESHFWLPGRMVHAFARDDPAEQAAMLVTLREANPVELPTVTSHALFLLEDGDRTARVVRVLTEPGRSAEHRLLGHALLAHIQMSGGRWRDAAAELDSLAQLDPMRAAEHAGLLTLLPLVTLPRERLEQVRRQLQAITPGPVPRSNGLLHSGDERMHHQIRTYLLATLHARLGEVDEAGRLARDLRRSDDPAVPGAARSLAAGIEAQLALIRDQPAEAEQVLKRFPSPPPDLDPNRGSPFLALRQERFLRAEALARLGRPEEALVWLSSYSEHSPFGRVYLAPAHFRSGLLLEQLGRKEEAISHYQRFLALWKQPDRELVPLVNEVRQRVVALTAELR